MSYAALRGKIREVFGSEKAFAEAMEMDVSTLSLKLNGKSEFTTGEIVKACQLLGIKISDVHKYFFIMKV